jgi:bacteriorhodopsin
VGGTFWLDPSVINVVAQIPSAGDGGDWNAQWSGGGGYAAVVNTADTNWDPLQNLLIAGGGGGAGICDSPVTGTSSPNGGNGGLLNAPGGSGGTLTMASNNVVLTGGAAANAATGGAAGVASGPSPPTQFAGTAGANAPPLPGFATNVARPPMVDYLTVQTGTIDNKYGPAGGGGGGYASGGTGAIAKTSNSILCGSGGGGGSSWVSPQYLLSGTSFSFISPLSQPNGTAPGSSSIGVTRDNTIGGIGGVLTAPGGFASLRYLARNPVITGSSPSFVTAPLTAPLTISLVGQDFLGSTNISIFGADCSSFTIIDDHHATCTIQPFTPANAGPYAFTMTAPWGSGVGGSLFFLGLPMASAGKTPATEPPTLTLGLSLIGGDLSAVRAGSTPSGVLLRSALANFTGVPGVSTLISSVAVQTVSAPALAFQALINSTVNSSSTLLSAVGGQATTTTISSSDPLNQPSAFSTYPANARRLQACAPVNINGGGTISVPVSTVSVVMTLPPQLYTTLGASTAEQQALLMQTVAAQMVYTASTTGSSSSSVTQFASQWAACTGMPVSLGVIGSLNVQVIPYQIPSSDILGSAANTAEWIGFAVFFFTTVSAMVLSATRNVKSEAKALYYGVALVTLTSALAYLLLALNGSLATITGHNGLREVEWLRYANWSLVALVGTCILGLLAGGHWTSILFVAFIAELGIAAAFAAAIDQGLNATWPLFTFALVFCFLPVFGILASTWRRHAYKVHPEIGKLYDVVAWILILLLVGYIVVWGCGDGGNVMSVDAQAITWTVFDIVAIAILGLFLICGRESIARYGSPLAWVNSGVAIDFTIPRSLYTSSASAYATEPGTALVHPHIGQPRDLAFARLHTATGTVLTKRN